MWTLTPKSITIAILITIAWFFGFRELWAVFTNFNSQWYWFVLATIWTTTLNDVFGHMILTHRLFVINTKSVAYRIFSFLFIVDHGWGPITGFCMAHHRHHQCSDQGDKDVQNWRTGWYTHGLVGPVNYLYQSITDWGDTEKYVEIQRRKFKEIFNDTWTFIIEEFSPVITILFWLTIYIVCPVVLFKIIFMGRTLLSIYTALAAILGHTKIFGGYRNFNLTDQSYNNLFFHYASLGLFPSMLQNNHHGTRYTLAKGSAVRWYEYDVSKHIARFLKIFMEKRD